jgi:hypothetical protein
MEMDTKPIVLYQFSAPDLQRPGHPQTTLPSAMENTCTTESPLLSMAATTRQTQYSRKSTEERSKGARPVDTLIREAREQAALWTAAYEHGTDNTLGVN